MERRTLLARGTALGSVLVSGCSQLQDSHTESLRVTNKTGSTVGVRVEVDGEGTEFAEERTLTPNAVWDVSKRFGPGSYQLRVEIVGGSATTESWSVAEQRSGERYLSVRLRASAIEITPVVD